MSKIFPTIDQDLSDFIARQHMFFVGSAPGAGGHVNISPKGADSFRVLGPTRVAYLDMTGSGIETLAHLKDNGRIVIMFCAFDGPARILRLHGTGTPHEKGGAQYTRLMQHFTPLPGARAIIEVDVSRIATSCGYSIPLYDYRGERDQLLRWAQAKGEDGIAEYLAERNGESIDGLPGFSGAT